MKRRKFFKNASLSIFGATIPFKGELLSFNYDLDASINHCQEVTDRVLVIVRLQGANDGLNTFVPDSQYGAYEKLRSRIKIPYSKLQPLDRTIDKRKNVLLHPSVAKLKPLYDSGYMSIVHAVGYNNYNYSHFTSDQVLWKGSDQNSNFKDGMLARYISKAYNVQQNIGIPNKKFIDPYALQLGNPASIISFRLSNGTSFEYNGNDFLNQNLSNVIANINPLVYQNSNYLDLIKYIKVVEEEANNYKDGLKERFRDGKNSSVIYEKSSLSNQLKLVARLIHGKSKTKIFQCTLGGFDTHSAQVDLNDTTKGKHATLLNEVSTAIDSFMKDLKELNLDKRVVLMSFSEFGRTVKDNGSGTDHGNLNPVFLIGPGVKSGIVGYHPNLSNIDSLGRYKESETQFNFKEIYACILRQWLGANETIIEATVGSKDYGKKLSLIDSSLIAQTICPLYTRSARTASEETNFTRESATTVTSIEYTAYPNPTNRMIYLKASDTSLKANIQVTLYDEGGHKIYSQPYNLMSNSGIDISRFPIGIYFLVTEDPLFGSSTHKIIKE